MTAHVQWHDLYKAAMLELNPTQLRNKIGLADAAMHQRMAELMQANNPGSIEELREIDGALRNLRVLERSELEAALSSGSRNVEPVAPGGAL